jgi:hypothetical protein
MIFIPTNITSAYISYSARCFNRRIQSLASLFEEFDLRENILFLFIIKIILLLEVQQCS